MGRKALFTTFGSLRSLKDPGSEGFLSGVVIDQVEVYDSTPPSGEEFQER